MPTCEQVAGLAAYKPWGGELGIPGDIISEERFVRATYYLSTPRSGAQRLDRPGFTPAELDWGV